MLGRQSAMLSDCGQRPCTFIAYGIISPVWMCYRVKIHVIRTHQDTEKKLIPTTVREGFLMFFFFNSQKNPTSRPPCRPLCHPWPLNLLLCRPPFPSPFHPLICLLHHASSINRSSATLPAMSPSVSSLCRPTRDPPH